MKYAVIAVIALLSFSSKAKAADISFAQGIDVKTIIRDINADPADNIPLALPARIGNDQSVKAFIRDVDYVFDIPVQTSGKLARCWTLIITSSSTSTATLTGIIRSS